MNISIRETPLSEAQVVDSCFEEDAYEAGISLLNHMRSASVKPRPDHVRILVLLALHPPAARRAHKTLSYDKAPVEKKGRGRKKATAANNEGNDMQVPLASETAAAVVLLHFYTLTLHPVHIMRALPAYKQLEGFIAPQLDADMHDSAVAKRSLILARKQDCPDCWHMLREGFIPNPTNEEGSTTQVDADDLAPIGRHAWPVFKWLVEAFEKDEILRQSSSSLNEPLFLSQIPQARANGAKKGSLWDCRTPVHVAMYCFEADGDFMLSRAERIDLGSRLMCMMVKLSATTSNEGPFTYLEPVNLVRTVSRRVRTFTPQNFDAFFRRMATDAPAFAISLLFLHLFAAVGMTTSNLFGGEGGQPVRAYARPRLKTVRVVMMSRPAEGGDLSLYAAHMRAKAHLVRAVVRSLAVTKESDDQEWRDSARSGDLQNTIRKAFTPETGLLGPVGAYVDEHLAAEAMIYRDELVRLVNSLAK